MRPVFIGGCPRSGTTMLGSLIGSHPQCVTTPESQFLLQLIRDEAAGIDPARALISASRHPRFKLWGLGEPDGGWRATARPSAGSTMEAVVRRYAHRVGRDGATCWVDHTTGSMMFADRLMAVFPGARFVHLVRDGRGVASSVMPLDWGPNTAFEAALWWMRRLAPGLVAEGALDPGTIVRIRFEDLVADPQRTLKGLCEFLGLEYHDDMVLGRGFAVPGYSRRQHSLVGFEPDPSRAVAWQFSLSARQVEVFEAATGDVLAMLGYPQRYGRGARARTGREAASDKAREAVRGAWNRAAHRRRLRRGVAERAGTG